MYTVYVPMSVSLVENEPASCRRVLDHMHLGVDPEPGVVAVRIAGAAVAKGDVAVTVTGIEDRGSQVRVNLLRILLGGDGDVDVEIAEGDDGALTGEAHVGEALGVVDDAADGADGEHEAGDDTPIIYGPGSRAERDSARR